MSDENDGRGRFRAPALGPAWSISVIAAALAAEGRGDLPGGQGADADAREEDVSGQG